MPNAFNESLSVLVVSCDRYRDLWPPFFTLFWKHWSDCPFPVYLGSNFAVYEDKRVHCLTAGEDRSWSHNVRLFVEQLSTPNVLLLLEDFFLRQDVSTARVLQCCQILLAERAACLRLYPMPGPDKALPGHTVVGTLLPSAAYRVSTQPAIWNCVELLALLRDGESAWEFETSGAIRSRAVDKQFLATYEPVFDYRHVVELGQWFWTAAKFYRKAQIGCDFSARPTMPPALAALKSLNRFRKNVWR